LLVLIVGPTAVGKNTVVDEILRISKKCHRRVACTTRRPRIGEVDGQHYHFLTRVDFKIKIRNGEFVEWAEVHGNLYGTLKQELDSALRAGDDVIFDLDFQGARQIKAKMPEAITIFFLPPTFEDLARRLDARKSGESEETKLRRLITAREEIRQAETFDYFLVNDKLDQVVLEIQKLIGILSLGKIPPANRFRNTEFLNRLKSAL